MRKALVVGINNYPSSSLNCCHNDAKKISELLEYHEDQTKNFDINLQLDVNADDLEELITECFTGTGDIALFYFSGHGYNDGELAYLVASNNKRINFDLILSKINSEKCMFKDKIIILDTCFSGMFGNISALNDRCAHIKEGVTILTSSHSGQLSVEFDKHGLFTFLLIEALSGGAADLTGDITPGGIYAFIDKALGAWEQRPIFKTNITRFITLRKVKPQVELGVIRKLCNYFESADSLYQLNPSYEPTNHKDYKHSIKEPYAIDFNTKIFSELQELESIGLVIPHETKHMYYAAMESKQCKLTAVGKSYWYLINNKKI